MSLMSFKIIFNYIVDIMLAVGVRILKYIFKIWLDLLYMCWALRTQGNFVCKDRFYHSASLYPDA